MALAWTKEHHAKAKAEKKALVKLQVQLKHCGGANYEISGAYDQDQALILFLTACTPPGDPRLAKALAALQEPAEKPLPECHSPKGSCTREDYCREIGHCVFDKCEHGRFYNEVCVPCGRTGDD